MQGELSLRKVLCLVPKFQAHIVSVDDLGVDMTDSFSVMRY